MRSIIPLITLIVLSGCSTMQPPRYSISVDNVQALKKYEDSKLIVSSFSQTAQFDSGCRLMGPIEPADSLSFPEFISKAMNDEFKMAGIYSEEGTKISGEITSISFSSSSGLTNGYWDISIKLTSANNNVLETANKYTFKSGFDAITACNATADALTPAVQDLIQKAVSDPKFSQLL